MQKILKMLSSHTVWAGIFGAGAYLMKQPHIGPSEVLTAISGVSAVSGGRGIVSQIADALAKKN